MREHAPEPPKLVSAASDGPKLLATFLAGNLCRSLIDGPNRAQHRAAWRTFLTLLTASKPSEDLAAQFHTSWHVGHHYMRELVEDDALMVKVARAWLPPYAGPAMTLWRGENIDRFEAGQVGMAWSDKVATAELFARGLNATGKGGVILKANAPSSAIIAGPSEHSIWLGEREFTVDPRLIPFADQLGSFPSRD